MDTQTQIERLIELAIVQRTELKELVAQLPQLREHLSTEIEKAFDEAEPQLRAELEEWTTKQAADKTAALGVALEAKIAELSKNLEISTQARYNAIIAERDENARLAAQAEAKIAEHAASLPNAVKEIVTAELARFPRAGEIDQLRKEFAEPRGLNPRGKWQAGETYNRLDLVTVNGDSFVSNIDGNKERPSRSATNWTLNAARGMGGGSGFTSLNNVLGDPSAGQIVGSEGGQYVRKTLVAGANITINETASAITIIGDEGQISLQDGTAAAPSLFFTNDPDTGIYRPAANTLGISVSGTQVAYFDANGITTVGAGGTFDGSVHAANGNANNPSLSFTSDQDTGFFRHQPNEIGVALGGTQKATLTSTTFTITPNLVVSGTGSINGTTIPASKTLVVTTDKLSALASTSSSELAGVISDETGTGALVFANTPTLVTPNIGAATGTSVNLSGSGTLGTTLTVNGTTDSSSKDTGTIVTEGGLGVEKSATIGGNLTVSGTTSTITLGSTNTANVAVNSSGALTVTSANGQTLVSQTSSGAHYIEIKRASQSTGQVGLSLNGGTSGNTWLMYQPASSNTLTWFGNSANRMSLDTSGNLTLDTGNLTVSGTGNSTFAGNVGIGVTPNAWSGVKALQITNGVSSIGIYGAGGNEFGAVSNCFYNGSNWIYSTTATATKYAQSGGAHYFSVAGSGTSGNTITFSDAMTLANNGNLLIGTPTDSGNGKLQLATHTTSAGGIGFGTDTSLYRIGTGWLALDSTGGDNPNLWFRESGSSKATVQSYLGDLYISTVTSGKSMYLRTGVNTTALTLDSSQNATFAGTGRFNSYFAVGGAPASAAAIYTQGNILSGVSQYSFITNSVFSSAATNDTASFVSAPSTQAASFTVATHKHLDVRNITKGSGSSVTTQYGLYVENLTSGGTNYAIYTNGGYIRFGSLPTSSAGLAAGTLWNDAGTLKIA